MWTFNNFPFDKVRARYGFTPADPPKWLEHAQLSAARLPGGCSGSFVSENGLIMTNHHCAQRCLQQLSRTGRDLLRTGFYAEREAEEERCPTGEINQLQEITDVTARIGKATAGRKGKDYNQAEKAEMSRIEKECQKTDRLRCEVVRLYNGGIYNLYRYRRFQDVRLVFAPEFPIAFFGGDPDNFNFPRYDLDVTFMRVWEDGKPAHLDQHFAWSPQGARDGELVFVAGHPGRTDRQLPMAELDFQRDVVIPSRLFRLAEWRGMLTMFIRQGDEERRIAQGELFGVENGFKALHGRLLTLDNRGFYTAKAADEQDLRSKVARNAELARADGGAWAEAARATARLAEIYKPLTYLERGGGFGSELFNIARTLVRGTKERQRPNEVRLREYRDSALPELTQELFSPAPIYDSKEILRLGFSLSKMREDLGADHPIVRKVLGKESPEELAARVVRGTGLKDVALRKQLWEGGPAAVAASKDPMIQLALLVDPEARAVRKQYEDEVEPLEKKSGEEIARARFALFGTGTYPDATFTLRLSYGQVRGYEDNGRKVAPFTTIGGLYARATGRPPFDLPERWIKAQGKLDPRTPLDFCTTNDITGGNSGSPMINKDGQIVGLIFDSNIYGLGDTYGYDEKLMRAVAVHSQAILVALDKVYGAKRILNELRPAGR